MLASQLEGVDVIIAGGGDELLANPGDLLLPGDLGAVFGYYPQIALDLVGLAVFVDGDHQSFYCCVPHQEGGILERETLDECLGELCRSYGHNSSFEPSTEWLPNRLRTVYRRGLPGSPREVYRKG